MTWKSILSAAAVAVTSASIAVAQPTIEVSAVENGGNIDWTVGFTPDGGSGSLGIELALEIVGDIVAAPTATLDFMETIDGTPIVNPGNDPFVSAVTNGITLYEGVSSVVSSNTGGGTVDGFFAALGSTAFSGTSGSQDALSFTTVGTAGEVFWDVLIEQGGGANAGGFTVTEAGSQAEDFGGMMVLGDSTGDGNVDLADLNDVLNNFGLDAPPAGGNADGIAGPVGLGDLNAVLNNFGFTSATAVPEPSSIVALLSVGLIGISRRTRR